MRLINQAGTMSFNFDDYVLLLDGRSLLLCDEGGEKTYVVGTYNTAERAQDIFIAIHARYHEGMKIGYIPEE